MTRVPMIRGCANILDEWNVKEDGSLVYRFAIGDIRSGRCCATGIALSSDDIHELTRERTAPKGSWYWAKTLKVTS